MENKTYIQPARACFPGLGLHDSTYSSTDPSTNIITKGSSGFYLRGTIINPFSTAVPFRGQPLGIRVVRLLKRDLPSNRGYYRDQDQPYT